MDFEAFPPITRRFGINTVTFYVRDEKKPFTFSEAVLREKSAFFKAAFRENPFTWGSERTMNLPKEDAKHFNDFIQWLRISSNPCVDATTTPSLFGGAKATPNTVGGATKTQIPNLFGGATRTRAPSLFGGATAATPSLVGGAKVTPILFGFAIATPYPFGDTAATPSLFGGVTTTPSLFGGATTTRRLFSPEQLVNLYLLAIRYTVPELKNYVCDHMISYANASIFGVSLFTMKKALEAYEQLPPSSGLRRLLVLWFAREMEQGRFSVACDRAWLVKTPEFAADLLCAMDKDRCEGPRTEKLFSELDRSKYYETMGTHGQCNPLSGFQPSGRLA